MTARMTLDQLNGLLEKALRGLVAERTTPHASVQWVGRWDDTPDWCGPNVDLIMAEWDAEVPKLWQPPEGETWGTEPGFRHGRVRPPHQGDPQPIYGFECYQCGLPITGDYGEWRDHSGRSLCMLNFVDQELKDVGAYYTDHRPKPFHGEEEDGDDVELGPAGHPEPGQ